MAAIDQDSELDALRPPVVEERLDRGADRAPSVENIVDEDDRSSFEREVELRLADDGLRAQRRFAASHLHVVAVEGDVDGAELGCLAGPFLDQTCEPAGERDAPRLDADERNLVELGVRLDDLVSDARERSRERAGVEEDLPERLHCAHRAARVAGRGTCVVIRLLSGLTGPG